MSFYPGRVPYTVYFATFLAFAGASVVSYMRLFFFTVILFGVSFSTQAQENSILYCDGRLKADTSLYLDKVDLLIWTEIEEFFLARFIDIFEMPALYIDAQSGISGIIHFRYDKKMKSFNLVKFSPSDTTDLKRIRENKTDILRRTIRGISTNWIKEDLLKQLSKRKTILYLPVELEVRSAKFYLNQKGEISLKYIFVPIRPDGSN